jgi:Ca2+-binding EF-hand superfamily protein
MKKTVAAFLVLAGFSMAAGAQDAATGEDEGPKFADFDKNEDGMIDQKEAEVLGETIKEMKNDEDYEFKFETADVNEDGRIDAREFTALMRS